MNLSDKVNAIKQVSDYYSKRLEKLGIYTVKDFLTYFPRDYKDASEITLIKDIVLNPNFEQKYTIKVEVIDFQNKFIRGGRTLQNATVKDETGNIECVFFNQKFLKDVMIEGRLMYLFGKVKKNKYRFQFYPESYEQIFEGRENVHLARIAPEYPLTAGVSPKWFRNRIKYLVDAVKENRIKLTSELKEINIQEDICQVHFPEDEKKLEQALNELSLLELINIHLKVLMQRKKAKKKDAVVIKDKLPELYEKFKALLSFELTNDQDKVIKSLISKLQKGELINELVQGDVGSGKTMIALFLSYVFSVNGYQTVILAPTTILAKQHYETFNKILMQDNKTKEREKIKIELVISENKKTESANILIGTSAVLARKDNLIKNLGIIIVDEQHRFGVTQREELLAPLLNKEDNISNNSKNKNIFPHYINMTATPIPRTIAETFFSDLDVSIIHDKPKGRQVIKSFVVPEEKRKDSYNWLIEKIKNDKEQVYWVVPLIEENEANEKKSVQKEFEILEKELRGVKVGMLHGKLKSKDKMEVMQAFKEGKIDVLVSTTVIEVGVDVPNATVMVIENAEQFGLAQLHQIRGRVGRGTKQSYFFMFTGENAGYNALRRLKFIAEESDGIKIAEFDLQQRGPGEVYGTRQSGIPALKIAKLNDIELIRKSKRIADELWKDNIRKIELFS